MRGGHDSKGREYAEWQWVTLPLLHYPAFPWVDPRPVAVRATSRDGCSHPPHNQRTIGAKPPTPSKSKWENAGVISHILLLALFPTANNQPPLERGKRISKKLESFAKPRKNSDNLLLSVHSMHPLCSFALVCLANGSQGCGYWLVLLSSDPFFVTIF